MNKKTFSGGITFALVVFLSIVTSGCSSNIDEPTFNAEMQNSSASNSISTTNGINVSSWYSPLVTPSGLLTDDETYVRYKYTLI